MSETVKNKHVKKKNSAGKLPLLPMLLTTPA